MPRLTLIASTAYPLAITRNSASSGGPTINSATVSPFVPAINLPQKNTENAIDSVCPSWPPV